jgi:hypothetical protein
MLETGKGIYKPENKTREIFEGKGIGIGENGAKVGKGGSDGEAFVGEAFEIFANIDKAKDLGWHPKYSTHDTNIELVKHFKELIKIGKISKNYMDDLDISKVKIGK